jgi:hypothetical protein
MINDRNAITVWVEYVLDQAGKRTILVVETNLQLDPVEVDFEPEQVEALCKDLEQHRKTIGYVDEVRLVRKSVPPSTRSVEVTGTFGDQAVKSRTNSTY